MIEVRPYLASLCRKHFGTVEVTNYDRTPSGLRNLQETADRAERAAKAALEAVDACQETINDLRRLANKMLKMERRPAEVNQ